MVGRVSYRIKACTDAMIVWRDCAIGVIAIIAVSVIVSHQKTCVVVYPQIYFEHLREEQIFARADRDGEQEKVQKPHC